ncbi:PilX N-terminal domain-containing pilus assembly protein [Pseudomonas tremae]|uniref:pilus assembly PilX family protein n=1 Tax=Pseudomonas syringae group TaxID=136849 RepID=UPI000EFDDFB0|nr:MULTISPECIES: PilX N-terminal domain-containing pilus assembly protein [Pseudomonas syringae group]MCF5805863.1 pilus assembly protein PilX [Pseudomonas tremae]MCF5810716.1 pilus assembly protein PilX [Pseudomonas tremae]MCQ2992113.1 PilX N-terminal domain-containing pilus assembly protein [Pseudomonas tremae]
MNTKRRFNYPVALPVRQRGMVLLVSLVFLLLLTLLGISSMQNATLQEKMAGSVAVRNISFQAAEAQLRLGESKIKAADVSIPACTPNTCAPPVESTTVVNPGVGTSGVNWIGTSVALFGIQNLGTTATPIRRPANCTGSVTMYRVTAIAIQGTSRTVLESIYANC